MADSTISRAVVYDASVYRGLVPRTSPSEALDRGIALARRDRACGAEPVAATVTALELAHHLADPSDPKHDQCLEALWLLVGHCSPDPNRLGGLNYFPLGSDTIAKAVYGSYPPSALELGHHINAITLTVASDPTPAALDVIRPHLKALSAMVQGMEGTFARMLGRFEHQLRHSPVFTRSEYKRLVRSGRVHGEASAYLLQSARDAMEPADPDPDFIQNAEKVGFRYPVAVEFLVGRMDRLVDGANSTLDANSFWDWQLSLLPGRKVRADGQENPIPIELITAERAIRRAADEAGNPGVVKTYADHCATCLEA